MYTILTMLNVKYTVLFYCCSLLFPVYWMSDLLIKEDYRRILVALSHRLSHSSLMEVMSHSPVCKCNCTTLSPLPLTFPEGALAKQGINQHDILISFSDKWLRKALLTEFFLNKDKRRIRLQQSVQDWICPIRFPPLSLSCVLCPSCCCGSVIGYSSTKLHCAVFQSTVPLLLLNMFNTPFPDPPSKSGYWRHVK